MIVRTVLAVAAIALSIATVSAQDPIAARKALMKENGTQAGLGGKMARGEEPFAVDKAKAIFVTYQKVATAHTLWPDTSKTGGETASLPAIWENKTDFNAKLTKLANEAKAAEAAVKDLDSFKAQFTEVQKNCGGCHQTYRKRQT